MRSITRALAICVCSFLFSIGVLNAQSTATIVGTVTDPTGAVVAGVDVKVTNVNTGQSRSVVTNSAGSFQAPQLQIGTYTVEATAPGFKKYEKTGITLNVNDTVRVDPALEVGQATESVTVAAEAVEVQSDSNERSDLISAQQVAQLAVNGRNIQNLAFLGTGVSTNSPDFRTPSALLGAPNISFNGQRDAHNLWMIDGGENYDRGGGGGISTLPSPDAIAEFKALTSNYSAEFGQGSGATMTMILKSGTRDFHASAWEFVRNNAFDARNFFANRDGLPQPVLKYNTFGYNIGGPVYIPGVYNKDRQKTFFFWNQEWRKLRQGTQSQVIRAFPASFRAGDFSSLGTPLRVPQTTDPAAINRFAQYGLTPGGAFPNNQIPAGLIDSNARALINVGAFPLPNASGNNFTSSPTVPTDVTEQILRMDHQISDKLNLMGHFIRDITNQSVATSLWGDSARDYPSVGTSINSPSYAAVIRLTQTINPTVVNETAFNYNGNRILNTPTGAFKKPADWTVPEYFSANNLDRLPDVNIAGNYGVWYRVGSWPWYNSFDSFQIRDDLSLARGNHNLKMGGSFMRTRKNQDIFGQTQGNFNFNGNATGDAFADFLLGYANTYHELAIQDNVHIRNSTFGAYFIDNWRASSRLTLNLGVRWEGVPHAYDVFNRLSNFVPTLYNAAAAPRFNSDGSLDASGPGFTRVPGIALSNVPFYLNGIGISGLGGYPRSIVKNYWNTFAPRVGFAYDLLGDQKTILRGGFGMFYERIQGNDVYDMGPNPPFSFDPSANNIYLSNPSVNYLTGASASTPIFPSNITALGFTDYKLPTSMQWSMGIQRQLATSTVLSASYVGNGNYHQPARRNIDTVRLNDPNRAAIAAGTYNQPNRNRIFPGFADVNVTEAATGANYQSLQIGLRMEAARDLTLQGSYTWSHELDYVSGDLDALSNPFDRRFNYGSGNLDRRHAATFNYVYNLPFFRNRDRGAVKTFLGGWVLSGITTFQTGTPLTPTLSDSGKQLGLGGGNTTARPDVVGSLSMPKNVDQWFGTSVYRTPAPLSFGNASRGSIVGPGRNNWNLALFKNFDMSFLHEGTRLEFRGETFNTFNHTQFRDVNVNFGNSNFGRVTSAWDARVIQLGMKLLF
jgi:Carboxypeptidase regulatory-like domain